MSNKKIFLDAFFDQFNQFLKELNRLYPNDSDFPTFLTTLSLMKTANPMLVVKFVKNDIIDIYGDKIDVKDESFFMNRSFEEHKEDVDMDIISKLKSYISDMPPTTKDSVWAYIQILKKLCLACLQ
jgi:hypothetical protein